jgi:Holliday junction resolvasome RuvABC DNA-binding subunit
MHKQALFRRLLPVVVELYQETAELSLGDGDLQLWYNRGYADGMVSALQQLGFSGELEAERIVTSVQLEDSEAFLPWGKAYRHGLDMGERETLEAIEGGSGDSGV